MNRRLLDETLQVTHSAQLCWPLVLSDRKPSNLYLNTFLLSVVDATPAKKKRGRPPKQQDKERMAQQDEDEAEAAKKAKRALNRFNGMSVAEVMAKTLPDVITYNLDILIVSYLPGTYEEFINLFT